MASRLHYLCPFIAVLFAGEANAGGFVGSGREYALIGGSLVGAAILEQWPPNTSHPLIGGEQKPYIKRERVPDWTLGVAHLAALSTIRFGPGGEDRVRYAHGYAMAASLTALSTSLAKGIVGRKRPNDEDAEALGKSTRSRSFYSGHASASFCLATYASLYTWHETRRPVVRLGVPVALYGVASYVAWSRVAENRHYPSDAIAGAVAGSLISALVYRWYDHMPTEAETMTIAPSPGGLAVSISLR